MHFHAEKDHLNPTADILKIKLLSMHSMIDMQSTGTLNTWFYFYAVILVLVFTLSHKASGTFVSALRHGITGSSGKMQVRLQNKFFMSYIKLAYFQVYTGT